MNRLNIFVIGLFFTVVVFTGCKKEECEQEYGEFCLYANVENFCKTAPSINGYLSSLSRNWSNERRLQALTNWLNSQPCIISAKLELEKANQSGVPTTKSTPLQPPLGTIAILLDENGTTKELFLEIGHRYPYESDSLVATGYRYMKPREVRMLFQPVSSVNMVFDFINSFDFEVLWLHNLWFSSTTHSRDYILDNLSGKTDYIAGFGIVPGSQTFSPTFHSMENKNYQDNWLKFMADYQLSVVATGNAQITFLVPTGKEREWAARFLADYEFITSTDVNWEFQGM